MDNLEGLIKSEHRRGDLQGVIVLFRFVHRRPFDIESTDLPQEDLNVDSSYVVEILLGDGGELVELSGDRFDAGD